MSNTDVVVAPSMSGGKNRRRSRSPTSWTWQHSLYPFKIKHRDRDGDLDWVCVHCSNTYKKVSGTTKFADHLRQKHKILQDGAIRFEKNQQSLLDLAGKATASQHRQTNASISMDVMERLLVRLITLRSLPYSVVEWAEFRDLLEYLNPDANRQIPMSHNTTKAWVQKNYLNEKDTIRQKLQSARSLIHFTVDSWS